MFGYCFTLVLPKQKLPRLFTSDFFKHFFGGCQTLKQERHDSVLVLIDFQTHLSTHVSSSMKKIVHRRSKIMKKKKVPALAMRREGIGIGSAWKWSGGE